jgi:hypothetical protein
MIFQFAFNHLGMKSVSASTINLTIPRDQQVPLDKSDGWSRTWEHTEVGDSDTLVIAIKCITWYETADLGSRELSRATASNAGRLTQQTRELNRPAGPRLSCTRWSPTVVSIHLRLRRFGSSLSFCSADIFRVVWTVRSHLCSVFISLNVLHAFAVIRRLSEEQLAFVDLLHRCRCLVHAEAGNHGESLTVHQSRHGVKSWVTFGYLRFFCCPNISPISTTRQISKSELSPFASCSIHPQPQRRETDGISWKTL